MKIELSSDEIDTIVIALCEYVEGDPQSVEWKLARKLEDRQQEAPKR